MTDTYPLPMATSPSTFFNSPLLQLPPRINPTPSLLSFCNIHPDNAIMYCYTCPAIMCDMCQINVHDRHLTMELAKASEVAENQSNRALDEIESYISIIESNIQKLSKSSNDISYKAYKVKQNVSSNIKQVVNAVLEREKELYLHIEEIKTAKQTFIKYQQEILRNTVGQLMRITNAISEAKNYLNISGNPENLIAVKEKASVEISKIESEGLIYAQLKDHWLSFSGSIDSLLDAITQYGTVKTSPMGSIGDGRALKGHHQFQLPQQNSYKVALQYYTGSLSPERNVASTNVPVVVKIGKDSPSPKPVLIIGDAGEKNNNLCRPWGVACDKEGHIIVADRSNNQIKVYDQNGNFMRKFGTRGSGPGQFDRPAGIVVDERNRIIVADKDNHRIQIVSKYGDYLLAFGEKGMRNGQFNYPWDVAVNTRCDIVVSDTRNHRIQLFNEEGEFLRKYGFETMQLMWKLLDSPRSVSFTPNGDILVSDFNNHHIVIIDYQLQKAKIFGPEKRAHPFLRIQGMKVDDVGNIVIADSRNNRIQVLDSEGNLKCKFGSVGKGVGQMDRPAGIALSPEGRIIVVDFGNNRILVY
ncbi:GSCOCG00010052001-RA-CDS [Cotesia congregata]|nr:GSCOCG00010052001-RA-CDS [Cotesia congregata]